MFSKKVPYTQEDISDQIGMISKLQKQRSIAQGFHKNDEYNATDVSIRVAQEVLQFMLEEVRDYLNLENDRMSL